MRHIRVSLSFSECEQAPFWSQGLISQPPGYFPNAASPLILQKWENNGVLHRLSPLWQSDWTLGVAGSLFTGRQLHPAGCVVGVPSVVWELCLQDTTLPGEKGRGAFYSLYSSSAIWLPSRCRMRLTSFKFWRKIKATLPGWELQNSHFVPIVLCIYVIFFSF